MNRLYFSETVILADGSFPEHQVPLSSLRNTLRIICCDGAAESLHRYGLEPYAIVGDCDSLTPEIIKRYKERIFKIEEQETNDLTKSVLWCRDQGFKDIVILGATGKREDHSIGNIALLAEYVSVVNVRMITDHGIFLPLKESSQVESFSGQQVSVFSIDPGSEISSEGLKYPLQMRKLSSWWQGTLNEATGDSIRLQFTGGPIILFMEFNNK